MSGEVSVMTEDGGVERLKAPMSLITKAGTKRVIYCHSDVVWTTVHATKERDLEKIESEVIAKTYEELENKLDSSSVIPTQGPWNHSLH
jgi:hypothetical protein